MSKIVFDIEVAFHPEIVSMAKERGVDEKKFCWHIDAGMRYVTHISYKIDKKPVKDLSLLDYTDNPYGSTHEISLLKTFSEVYNKCDESVAHYGSKFDIRFLNSRIARAGLPPLKPIKLHDTWRILKDRFALADNRLETAIAFFNCPYAKPSLNWNVWREVSLGNVKAHKLLRNRCHYDTLSLAWIYDNKLDVYDDHRVNKSLTSDRMFVNNEAIRKQLEVLLCPGCGNKGTVGRQGYKTSKTSVSIQLKCRHCYGWFYGPVTKKGILGVVR